MLFGIDPLLAWVGVVHWLLDGLGLLADYRPVFRSITPIQGFMQCFAVGFLFTAIPGLGHDLPLPRGSPGSGPL